MGRFVPLSQLLLCRWAYSRRCKDGYNLVDPERCEKANRSAL